MVGGRWLDLIYTLHVAELSGELLRGRGRMFRRLGLRKVSREKTMEGGKKGVEGGGGAQEVPRSATYVAQPGINTTCRWFGGVRRVGMLG